MIETLGDFDSSNVSGATYNHGTKELQVTFRNGSTYAYAEANPQTWQNLKDAKSKGGFLKSHIIPRHQARKLA